METKNSRALAISVELPFRRSKLCNSALVAKADLGNHLNVGVVYVQDRVRTVAVEPHPLTAIVAKSRFILQDCLTGQFIRCDSGWSDDILEALDFLSARRAVFFGMKELSAEFHILEIGIAGTLATATIKMGLLKWSKPPCALRE